MQLYDSVKLSKLIEVLPLFIDTVTSRFSWVIPATKGKRRIVKPVSRFASPGVAVSMSGIDGKSYDSSENDI